MVSKISGFVRSGLAYEPQTCLLFLNSADPTISEPGTGYTTETHFSIAFEGFNVKCDILVVVVVVVCFEKERNLGYKRYTHKPVSPLMRSEVYLVLIVDYQVFVF